MKARINGISINYKVEGEGESLVIIQGIGSTLKHWAAQLTLFSKHFQCIVFDNRGVGDSEKPKGPYSSRQMADDTVGLMDHLGLDKAHVLGISMGGLIAQEIAINYPQRVGKLVLGCTTPCNNDLYGLTPEFKKSLNELVGDHKALDAKLGANKWYYRFLLSVLFHLQARQLRGEALTGYIAQKEGLEKHDVSARLSSIKAKTLVIAGSGDRVIRPESSRFMAKMIPGSNLVMLENASHFLMLENKNRFNSEIIDFLKS